MSYGLTIRVNHTVHTDWLIRMVHMDCQSVWPTIKKNVIFKQNTMIQTKQCNDSNNQQPKSNDSNKKVHKQIENDMEKNLTRRRTEMRQANKWRRRWKTMTKKNKFVTWMEARNSPMTCKVSLKCQWWENLTSFLDCKSNKLRIVSLSINPSIAKS